MDDLVAAEIRRIVATEDFYGILGITTAECTPDSVRRQYLRISRRIHPDKNKDDELATKAFQKLSVAYETLRNPTSRAAYDLKGTPVSANSDDVFAEVIKQVYRDFFDGEFEIILQIVDQINRQNPDLKIDRSVVRETLLSLRKAINEVSKITSDVCGDLLHFAELYGEFKALRYRDVLGRARVGIQLAQVLLRIPINARLPLPKVATGAIKFATNQLDLALASVTKVSSWWDKGASLLWSASWSGAWSRGATAAPPPPPSRGVVA